MDRLSSPRKIIAFLLLFVALPLALACAFAGEPAFHTGPSSGVTTGPVDVFAAPAESDHQPPRFLPAIALYDADGRFIALEIGKTFSYTCREALNDTQVTLAKATTLSTYKAVGLCIPVPTYNAADLVPDSAPKKDPDNTL